MSELQSTRRKRACNTNTSVHQASASKKSFSTKTQFTSPHFKDTIKDTTAASNIDPNHKKKDEDKSSPSSEPGIAKSKDKDIKLSRNFYDQTCEVLAKRLLGKVLVRILDSGERVSGTIVETESYLGGEDHASHSHKGKRTNRNEPMFMAPGTAYVYHIYGMYTCFNISSRGDGAAVLIRSLEAIEGAQTMRRLRGAKRTDNGAKLKHHQLCNGPSKLTMALDIQKDAVNKEDLSVSGSIWVEDGEAVPEELVVKCPRVGISCSEEWVKAPLRFYIRERSAISVINKGAK